MQPAFLAIDSGDPLGGNTGEECQGAGRFLALEVHVEFVGEVVLAEGEPVGPHFGAFIGQEIGDTVEGVGDGVLEQPAWELSYPVVGIGSDL